MQAQLYQAAMRAARLSPSFLDAALFRLMLDENGMEMMDDQGRYGWEYFAPARVSFDTWQPVGYPGITGNFDSSFRVTVLADPITPNPLTLPDLSRVSVIRLAVPRQPFPVLSLVTERIGSDAAGITHKFAAKAITPDQLAQMMGA